jgi:hypothetical protein
MTLLYQHLRHSRGFNERFKDVSVLGFMGLSSPALQVLHVQVTSLNSTLPRERLGLP